MIGPTEAETLLAVWGQILRDEVEAEVGLPSSSAGFGASHAPDWGDRPPGRLKAGDIERILLAAHEVRTHHKLLFWDMRGHYRDGVRLSRRRADECRLTFARYWDMGLTTDAKTA